MGDASRVELCSLCDFEDSSESRYLCLCLFRLRSCLSFERDLERDLDRACRDRRCRSPSFRLDRSLRSRSLLLRSSSSSMDADLSELLPSFLSSVLPSSQDAFPSFFQSSLSSSLIRCKRSGLMTLPRSRALICSLRFLIWLNSWCILPRANWSNASVKLPSPVI